MVGRGEYSFADFGIVGMVTLQALHYKLSLKLDVLIILAILNQLGISRRRVTNLNTRGFPHYVLAIILRKLGWVYV